MGRCAAGAGAHGQGGDLDAVGLDVAVGGQQRLRHPGVPAGHHRRELAERAQVGHRQRIANSEPRRVCAERGVHLAEPLVQLAARRGQPLARGQLVLPLRRGQRVRPAAGFSKRRRAGRRDAGERLLNGGWRSYVLAKGGSEADRDALLDGVAELVDLRGRERILRVQPGHTPHVGHDGARLRQHLAIDLEHWHLPPGRLALEAAPRVARQDDVLERHLVHRERQPDRLRAAGPIPVCARRPETTLSDESDQLRWHQKRELWRAGAARPGGGGAHR